MNELITVIVPVYKVEKYLRKCVDSILSQTYTNLEIILVDDGSPDECPRICDEYLACDNRILVIHKKNGGLSDARNYGLDNATGEYIVFVDSDDYIAPNMIEELYIALFRAKADMAICSILCVDEEGNIWGDNMSPIKTETLKSSQIINNKFFTHNKWYWVVAWNKLYKASLFSQIRYPVGKLHEDEFTIHQLLLSSNTVACVNQNLYYYVQRPDSIMNSRRSIKALDLVEALLLRANDLSSKMEFMETAENLVNRALLETHSYMSETHSFNRQHRIRYRELKSIYRKCVKNIWTQNKRSTQKSISLVLHWITLYGAWVTEAVLRRANKYVHRAKNKLFKKIMSNYADIVKGTDCVLIDTPTHDNLGDHAIALSERQLLENNSCKYIELTASDIENKEKLYAAATPNKQIIFVHGGGFMGSIWPKEEYCLRRIIEAFSANEIIVFPQTVTFDMETEEGRLFFEESKRIYSSHKKLTVYVREKMSLDFMKDNMPEVTVKFVPDIVTVFNYPPKLCVRSGILLCMRADRERSISNSVITRIYNIIAARFSGEEINFTDTVLSRCLSPEERKAEVEQKLKQFAQSKLIITDRLHGMIFAAITNTPCIAMSNSNGKVKLVYEWIKNNDYIRFANSIDEFEQHLKNLDLNKQYKYNRSLIEKAFDPLIAQISEMKR